MKRPLRAVFTLALLLAAVCYGAVDRYALILQDPPVSAHVRSRKDLRMQAAANAAAKIEAAQQSVRRELDRRKIHVTGSVNTLLNAVFVIATPEQRKQLHSLPGVRGVALLPPLKRHQDAAAQLVKAPAAWNLVGGVQNAGAGVKIAMIDTGIDQTHPAFQDSSLQIPAAFPPRDQYADPAFTNNKVIVARSYVELVMTGSPDFASPASDPNNPASYSRPDDTSARDRVGHGTAAAMIAAGVQNSGPEATITGIAPKAWLGNYKIFGSPGVNDTTYGDVVIKALEDAFNDGMDIAVLALGSSALYGPLETNTSGHCDPSGLETDPCDIRADAVENAVRGGMLVVVSAGNDGDLGLELPTLNTISSPGTAPSALTVGASTNSHSWAAAVTVSSGDFGQIPASPGDSVKPATPVTAPGKDVSQLQNDGKACAPLPANSLTGAIALILRGDCDFNTKALNAQRAGAVGVIFYNSEGLDYIFAPGGLAGVDIPTLLVGNQDGKNLKGFIAAHPDRTLTMDFSLHSFNTTADRVASFSSRGPGIGDFNIKPEIVAPGTGLYLATQSYDPNSEMYDASRYTVAQGTSFAAPMAAGAAALVRQRLANSGLNFTAQQLPALMKSAVVNAADPNVQTDSGLARITSIGAGRLDAEAALKTTLAVAPATLGFGEVISGSLPISRTLTFTNIGNSVITVTPSVAPRDQDGTTRITLQPTTLVLPPGQSNTITVRLEALQLGTLPKPGSYEGVLTVAGGAIPIRVPYLYVVGDNIARDAFPLLGSGFVGNVDERIPGWLIGFKLIDQYGVPVRNAAVNWSGNGGGASIESADGQTDIHGIAAATGFLGSQPGEQGFKAGVAGLTVFFDGYAYRRPAITTNQVFNAGSLEADAGKPVAPGSYIAIKGSDLSDVTRVFSTPYLPLSLAGVTVSFDRSDRGISVPGRLHFVSPNQVNVQVPWELAGLDSADMKVSIGDSSSAVYRLPLAAYTPAAFEYQGLAIAQDQPGYNLITSSNPAKRGSRIILYANGLGPVNNQPASGEPSPVNPVADTKVRPTVTIGGRPATVEFAGLTPTAIGLYQINVIVDPDTPTGVQPVVITSNGINSKQTALPIQ